MFVTRKGLASLAPTSYLMQLLYIIVELHKVHTLHPLHTSHTLSGEAEDLPGTDHVLCMYYSIGAEETSD